MSKTQSLLIDFEKTLSRLAEVLQQEKTDIVRDSAIKRFELVFDLSWKALKTFLEENHNVICNSPKTCFKEAFHQGILDYNDFWLDVVSERNYTAHTYKEKLAEQIFAKLPTSLKHFQGLLMVLKSQEN